MTLVTVDLHCKEGGICRMHELTIMYTSRCSTP
nr:MAG TPA: hypothetical protein [Caudoviricetes sp.]